MTLGSEIRLKGLTAGVMAAVVLVGCGLPQAPVERLVAESNRGVALMGSFDYDGARTVFADLAELFPGNPDLLVNLAIATLNRQAEGDEAHAMETLNRALELDSGNLRARYCRGLLEIHAGEAEAALADFEVVVAADPEDPDAVYFVGQCLMQLDRSDEALEYYRRAIELDPYLRSAYYRTFQTLQRSGRREEAMAILETFKKLEDNPRGRLVEFKYTRMGRRGEVIPLGGANAQVAIRPSGPVFDEPVAVNVGNIAWRGGKEAGVPAPSLSVNDINGDGLLDLFFAAAVEAEEFVSNAVALGLTEGGFMPTVEHPLAEVTDVNAALWGDLDNDGLTDVYFCRRGTNQLWRATADGGFEEITSISETAGGDWDTVDGALIDADHDGDLDIFLVNS
ncbi:MAG: FG-GAP-like repeat-containing protein, partial [Acidobacteriota bacterium]